MGKTFNHPFVVGIVGDRLKHHLKLRNKFELEFKRSGLKNVTYLLLRTQSKELKNLITCMKLMDVVAVNLVKKYEKAALKLIDKLDKSAKTARRVNLIAKSGRTFTGYFVKDTVAESIKIIKPLIT
jgi:shikimate 5-dehydrogenase